MPHTSQLEIERKYDVDEETLPPALVGVGAIAVEGEPTTDELVATYLDTAGLDLARARIAVRARSGGGDEGWHVKLPPEEEGRRELGEEVKPVDILKFKDSKKYPDRLTAAKSDTGEDDALVVMQGSIESMPVVVAAFEFKFIGGSMGSVVGERFVRGVRAAVEAKAPFVCVAASGGARMQEGLNSLMQMAKTSAALQLLTDAKLPFISVLTDPTMGGVSSSFAFLGDVVLAEPKARIGFAGARVIEQTVRETLPEGFQRAEFLLSKGAVDMVVDRRELKRKLAELSALLMKEPAPV